jgi:hypothetical protein
MTAQPTVLVQPFVAYIRAHEKKMAGEIGTLKIQLREAQALIQK